MQFAIIAHDDTDEGAVDRRLAARERHVAFSDELVRSGNGLFGGAILNDSGEMIGTIKIVEFESREEFDNYLAAEPYATGSVWKDIQVVPFRMGPSYARNAPS